MTEQLYLLPAGLSTVVVDLDPLAESVCQASPL